jgi:hypothetical protein
LFSGTLVFPALPAHEELVHIGNHSGANFDRVIVLANDEVTFGKLEQLADNGTIRARCFSILGKEVDTFWLCDFLFSVFDNF